MNAEFDITNERMKLMFTGTTQQLINALEHMGSKRPLSKAEKVIVKEAASRLRAVEKQGAGGAANSATI